MNEALEELKGNSFREMIRDQESGLRRVLKGGNSTMPPKLENQADTQQIPRLNDEDFNQDGAHP